MIGDAVVTAAEMRALEVSYAEGNSDGLWSLMRNAGEAAAKIIAVRTAGRDVLVLCGPGNNGGDGYVIAAALENMKIPVRVARLAEPASELCARAAGLWTGSAQQINAAAAAPVFVDCGFGTGLTRDLDADLLGHISRLGTAADYTFALDLPSGVHSDSGAAQPEVSVFDETLVPAALKPAHLLCPSASKMGRLTILDIGLSRPETSLRRNTKPAAVARQTSAHKYQRGHVAVAVGEMPGAAWLACRAAQKAGAGFVTAVGRQICFPPSSLVEKEWAAFETGKIDTIVVGPGLGRTELAREIATRALGTSAARVVDGDLFSLFAGQTGAFAGERTVLTPHEGEFVRFFGELSGSKVERARRAAQLAEAVVVLKGADTVIAHPDGRAVINDHAHPRLATAGSGDVLAGVIAAELAAGREAYEAACTGVWRHGDAGLRGRDGLIAEDLLELL